MGKVSRKSMTSGGYHHLARHRFSLNSAREGQARLAEIEGIHCGYAAAPTVAALIRMAGKGAIRADETVLLNLTD